MSFIEIRNLTKRFENTEAFSDVTFAVEKGEVIAVIGPSGSGKTTILRCLNFLEIADKGQVSINDEIIFDADKEITEKEIAEKRKHFGLVFQSFNLFPQYNVVKNITLAKDLKDPKNKDDHYKKAKRLLKEVDLEDKEKAYPYQLSGGQQQRVAIARALAQEPDVLCFDEPTSALDPALVGEVVRLVKDLKANGRTLLIVTHDMSFAKRVADRIVYLANGKLIEIAETNDFFNKPKMSETKEFLKTLVL